MAICPSALRFSLLDFPWKLRSLSGTQSQKSQRPPTELEGSLHSYLNSAPIVMNLVEAILNAFKTFPFKYAGQISDELCLRYLIGFSDRCARQWNGSIRQILMGSRSAPNKSAMRGFGHQQPHCGSHRRRKAGKVLKHLPRSLRVYKSKGEQLDLPKVMIHVIAACFSFS